MSKILYIKANQKESNSRTFEISDFFINEYTKIYPLDKVDILDLYKEKIDFLQKSDVLAHKDNKNTDAKSIKYAKQFMLYDKIIISAPFWNLSIPAILKAYIDYICVSGITFSYTKNGPVGLCKNKKILHVVTRGGNYSDLPMSNFEMGDKYLRTIFSFLGINDFTTISCDGLDIIGVDVNKKIDDAKIQAKNLAQVF